MTSPTDYLIGKAIEDERRRICEALTELSTDIWQYGHMVFTEEAIAIVRGDQ